MGKSPNLRSNYNNEPVVRPSLIQHSRSRPVNLDVFEWGEHMRERVEGRQNSHHRVAAVDAPEPQLGAVHGGAQARNACRALPLLPQTPPLLVSAAVFAASRIQGTAAAAEARALFRSTCGSAS